MCTASRSERKSKRGAKLTSSSENSAGDGRFHLRDVQIIHKCVQTEGPGGDTLTGHSVTIPGTQQLTCWLQQKPTRFCSNGGRRRTPGQNHSHNICTETLHNVGSTATNAERIIFHNTEGEENNASFVI